MSTLLIVIFLSLGSLNSNRNILATSFLIKSLTLCDLLNGVDLNNYNLRFISSLSKTSILSPTFISE